MIKIHTAGLKEKIVAREKILLVLLPFWTPQVPPLGMACLKSYLQPHGFDVKTVDTNIEDGLRKIYNKYFDLLRGYVSESKRGNFYNIGHDVLQNHMMAHLNYPDEKEYIELVKILVFKTFYQEIEDGNVTRLNRVLAELYEWLERYLTELLEKEKPGVLGVSMYRGTIPASMFALKLAKRIIPHVKTVVGGAAFAQSLGMGTKNFGNFLEKTKDYIDKIIVGEGEHLFLQLLNGQLPGAQRVYTLEDINGQMLDLSTVDIPDFSDFNLQLYPNLAAYASRSCPFQCNFCSETVYWGKYRKKKVTQLVNELIQLYKRNNSQLFLMCDSLLNPIATKLAARFLQSEVSIYWDGYIRVDHQSCNPERVLLWRQGGLYRARLGVESGSQRVLAAMNKRITVQQIKSTLFNLACNGIKTTTYWVIGYPGETEEDFLQTLELIEELKNEIYEAECNPFGYYLTGQVKSMEWSGKNKPVPLYPESAEDMLVIQTWIMNGEPSREKTYERIRRFTAHCSNLGIPNPYSLYDIYNADERWKKLHKNAVPSLIHFKNRSTPIHESKNIKKLNFAQNNFKDEMSLGF